MKNASQSWSTEEAIKCVEFVLGPSQEWAPSIIEYRLSSENQRDWLVEVGHWLLTAQNLGFLPALQKRLIGPKKNVGFASSRSVNGPSNLGLGAALAEAMAVHFFVLRGWNFISWEPESNSGKCDVDFRLESPSGCETDFQVKAPDQPGEQGPMRRTHGEYDDRIVGAARKALSQLHNSAGPARVVVICPQRDWPAPPGVLGGAVLGSTFCRDEGCVLPLEHRGSFSTEEGKCISAAIDLHLLRGIDRTEYRGTVFLNPWCSEISRLSREEFFDCHVCGIEGDRLIWTPKEPSRDHTIPSGTLCE